jgi:hypothetical protein
MDMDQRDLPPDLPPELERFGPRLERAVTSDLKRSTKRRSLMTGVGVAAVAAVAVFAGIAVFGSPGGHGPSGLDSAVALDKAAAALERPSGVIVHVHTVGTQTAAETAGGAQGDTTKSSSAHWEDESWQLTEAPFTRRQIETGTGVPRAETGVVDGRSALYDAATDTVYAGGEPYKDFGQSSEAEGFREEALKALHSGKAKVAGHETVDGRDAIRIVVSADQEYLVDAQTYDPVEWRTTGDGSTSSLRFVAYEKLPLTPSTKDLLDLQAQHPGAKVDTDPAHYQDAMGKLFPKG